MVQQGKLFALGANFDSQGPQSPEARSGPTPST